MRQATRRPTLWGGAGYDRFDFTALGWANADAVKDFNPQFDTIGLKSSIFSAVGSALSSGEFHVGSGAHDATDRIIYNKATGALSYDKDGSGAAAAVVFATLDAGLSLSHNDFLVI